MVCRAVARNVRCAIRIQSDYPDGETPSFLDCPRLVLIPQISNNSDAQIRGDALKHFINPIVRILRSTLGANPLKQRSVLFRHAVLLTTLLIKSSSELEQTGLRLWIKLWIG